MASDLGWRGRAPGGELHADIVRATQALERLCEARSVLCFPRARGRARERGEVRLYCTPGYLERLSSAATGDARRQAI